MKIVLGFFMSFFVGVFLLVAFDPESAHEIIALIHGVRNPVSRPPVLENGTETSNENLNDNSATTPQVKSYPYIREYESSSPDDNSATTPRLFQQPRNESQMLDWLEVHNYEVEKGYGIYYVSWRMRKRTSLSKPTAIVVRRDGTVVPRYEQTVVVNESGVAVVGQNVILNGGYSSHSIWGKATINNNGITTTASLSNLYQDEDGYWWIEIIRSFGWVPGQDNIEEVWTIAKKITE